MSDEDPILMRIKYETELFRDAACHVEKLEREMAELREAQAWRPIETAPKDEWVLIGRVSEDGTVHCGMSMRCYEEGSAYTGEPSGYFWATDFFSMEEPEFWMPLPTPPAKDVTETDFGIAG